MDLHLTDEERGFRDEIRRFLAEHLTDELRDGQLRTTGVYPEPPISRPWQRALAARGWLAPLWPAEWTGVQLSAMQRFILEAELGIAGAPPIPPFGIRLVGPVILRYGTEAQKRHYLPRILSGEDYWCQGYSEPGAGSDLASLQCRAVREGDHYVVTGTKIWTTHAHFANRMFALVRTSAQGKPQEGISFLLLDMQAPGVTVRPIRTISGEHDVNQVFLDDVRVPAENLIGRENDGWTVAKYLLEFERGGGLISGRLRAALTRLRRVIDHLDLQGAGLLTSAAAQAKFAAVAADLDTFEMLELSAQRDLAPGESIGAVAPILKLQASRIKQAIGELGIELLGPYAQEWWSGAIGPEEALDDALRLAPTLDYLNGRANTIFGGATEVQLGLIARSTMAG